MENDGKASVEIEIPKILTREVSTIINFRELARPDSKKNKCITLKSQVSGISTETSTSTSSRESTSFNPLYGHLADNAKRTVSSSTLASEKSDLCTTSTLSESEAAWYPKFLIPSALALLSGVISVSIFLSTLPNNSCEADTDPALLLAKYSQRFLVALLMYACSVTLCLAATSVIVHSHLDYMRHFSSRCAAAVLLCLVTCLTFSYVLIMPIKDSAQFQCSQSTSQSTLLETGKCEFKNVSASVAVSFPKCAENVIDGVNFFHRNILDSTFDNLDAQEMYSVLFALEDALVGFMAPPRSEFRACSMFIRSYFCMGILDSPCQNDCTAIGICPNTCQVMAERCPSFLVLVDKVKLWEDLLPVFIPYEPILIFAKHFLSALNNYRNSGICAIPGVSDSLRNCIVIGMEETPYFNLEVPQNGNCSLASYERQKARSRNDSEQFDNANHLASMLLLVLSMSYVVLLVSTCFILPFAKKPQDRVWMPSSAMTTQNQRAQGTLGLLLRSVLSSGVLLATSLLVLPFVIGSAYSAPRTARSSLPFVFLIIVFQFPLFHFILQTSILFNWMGTRRAKSSKSMMSTSTMRILLPNLATRVKDILRGIYVKYWEPFGMRGEHFFLGQAAREAAEMILQSLALRDSLGHLSNGFTNLYAITIFLNALIAPLLILKRNKKLTVLIDSIFDAGYIALNGGRFFLPAYGEKYATLRLLDTLSVGFPIISVTRHINFVFERNERIRQKRLGNRKSVRRKLRSKRLQRIASLKFTPTEKKTAAIIFAILSCAGALTLLCGTLVSSLKQSRVCLEQFGECLWGAVEPKIYQRDRAYFSKNLSCYVSKLDRIDIRHCSAPFHPDDVLAEFSDLEMGAFRADTFLPPGVFPRRISELIIFGKLATLEMAAEDEIHTLDLSDMGLDNEMQVVRILNMIHAPLKMLNLSGNSLIGVENIVTILSERFDESLMSVDLSRNEIRDLPPRMFLPDVFKNLNVFDVSKNRVDSLSADFYSFANRIRARSGDVNFGRNPLKYVNWLDMKGPIPSWIGLLTSLEFMNLSGKSRYNCIESTLPENLLSQLTNLKTLYLKRVCSNGANFPHAIQRLTNLQSIVLEDIYKANWTTIPAGLAQLTALERLEIDRLDDVKQWTNEKPVLLPNLCLLSQLKIATFEDSYNIGNQMQPCLFKSLEIGIFQSAYPREVVPAEIGSAQKIRDLRLLGYSDDLPTTLGLLTNLFTLRLPQPQRSRPTIPLQLGNLRCLLNLKADSQGGNSWLIPSEILRLAAGMRVESCGDSPSSSEMPPEVYEHCRGFGTNEKIKCDVKLDIRV